MELLTIEYPSDTNIAPALLLKFHKVVKFWRDVTKYGLEETYWRGIDDIVVRQTHYRRNAEASNRLGRIMSKDDICVKYRYLEK